MTAPNRQDLDKGLFIKALDTVSEGSLITDAEQRIVYANAAIRNLTGYSEAELIGSNCRMLQGTGTNPDTVRAIRDTLASGRNFTGDILNYCKDGTPFWNSLTITSLNDHAGDTTHFVSVQRDVSQQMHLQEKLLFQATHDPITGLHNRLAMDDRLTNAMARSQRRGTAIAVAMVNLDDFTQINDSHGYPVGDEALRVFARRLGDCTRADDFLARTGGDEFFFIFEGLDPERPLDGIRSVLERLDAALSEPLELEGDLALHIRMSMGIAVSLGHAIDSRVLVRAADDALYAVKSRKATRETWWEVARIETDGESPVLTDA